MQSPRFYDGSGLAASQNPFAGSPTVPYASQPVVLPRSAAKRTLPTSTIVIIGVVAVALLGVGIVASVAWRKISTFLDGGSEFADIPSSQQAIQEAVSKGEPMTAAALEAYYRLPVGTHDTTALWVSAGNLLATDEFDKDLARYSFFGQFTPIPPPEETWNDFEVARQVLASYRESLKLAHSAADQGGAARYPTKFADGMKMDMSEVDNARRLSRLLFLETHVRAHEGDVAGVASSLHAVLSLAHSLDGYPLLVPGLVRLRIADIAESTLLALNNYVEFSDADLQSFRTDIERLQSAKNLYLAMVGERVIIYESFSDPKQAVCDFCEYYSADSAIRPTEQQTLEAGAARSGEADKAFFLHLMANAVSASHEPYPRGFESLQRIQEEFNQFKAGSNVAKWTRPLSLLLSPAFSVCANIFGHAEANHRMTQIAIALEQYQRGSDTPPTSLQALVPKYLKEVPSDPFDGQPLRCVQKDDQLLLHSVGNDRKDDGGKGDEKDMPDIVRRIPIFSASERQTRITSLKNLPAASGRLLENNFAPSVNLLTTLTGLWSHSSFKGNWSYRDGSLWSSQQDVASWKNFSGTIPPTYRLLADVEPMSGEGSFNLAFVVEGQPVMLVLDGWDGAHSGLNLIKGQTGNDNSTTYSGRVLRAGKTNRVVLNVQPGQVEVAVNGQRIISWSGEPGDLSLDGRFWPAWDGKFYVGSWRSAFRLSRLELAPLSSTAFSGTSPPGTSSSAAQSGNALSGNARPVASQSKGTSPPLTRFADFSLEVPDGWINAVPDRAQTKAMLLLGGKNWWTAKAMIKVDVGKPAASSQSETAKQFAQSMHGQVVPSTVDFDGQAGMAVVGSSTSLDEPRHVFVVWRNEKAYLIMGATTTSDVDLTSILEQIRKSWKWTE